MSIQVIGGLLIALVTIVAGAFGLGKSSGKKEYKINELESEIDIRDKYEEINTSNIDINDVDGML